jgi:hypothetical protein
MHRKSYQPVAQRMLVFDQEEQVVAELAD